MLRIVAGGLSDVGRVRSENQDNFGDFGHEKESSQLGRLFIIADGVGGHRGGKLASTMAVGAVAEAYYREDLEATAPPRGSSPSIERRLLASFREANDRIFARALLDPAVTGMASTCTALVLCEGRAFVAHLGDSRAYLVRNGAIRQLTHDHSLVQGRVDAGMLTPEEARTHEDRNIITRSLGFEPEIEPDLLQPPLDTQPADLFVMSTDGLHGLLLDEEIAEMVTRYDPAEACRRLVAEANERGGSDNITVQILRIES